MTSVNHGFTWFTEHLLASCWFDWRVYHIGTLWGSVMRCITGGITGGITGALLVALLAALPVSFVLLIFITITNNQF